MANAYHHSKRVSVSHAAMLAAYERAHGTVYVNQGRRTLAEQAAFYAAYLRGGTLAARPWGGAPHIKWGADHHALDINADVVGRVRAFYAEHGIPTALTVRGEPWHMDTLNEAALKAAAGKVGHLDATRAITLTRGQTGPSVIRLKKRLYDKGVRGFGSRYSPFYSKATAAAVRRFQITHGLKADGITGPSTWKALS